MRTVIGYTLTGQDNDTFMFENDAPSLKKCAECGYRVDFQAFNPKYRLGKTVRRWDIASTYDGQRIVSRRFKEVCDRHGLAGIRFGSFEQEPDFFHATATREIVFDPDRAKTRFGKKCGTCRNFDSIVGPYVFFKAHEPLPSGFFRSDLIFASGDEKSPLLLASVDVHDLLRSSGLTGLEFSPVYTSA